MHLNPYPVEFVTVKNLDYDCMHSGPYIIKIDQTLVALIIPLARDTIRAFWCFIILQFDEK